MPINYQVVGFQKLLYCYFCFTFSSWNVEWKLLFITICSRSVMLISLYCFSCLKPNGGQTSQQPTFCGNCPTINQCDLHLFSCSGKYWAGFLTKNPQKHEKSVQTQHNPFKMIYIKPQRAATHKSVQLTLNASKWWLIGRSASQFC